MTEQGATPPEQGSDGVAPADDVAVPVDVDGAAAEAEGTAADTEAGEAAEDELTVARRELAERTADLQRVQAEYVNYRKRVDRDRDLVKENATYGALAPIVEVLDTIDRAREHGELEPGFKSVAELLERTVANSGLVRFGASGDPFDPTLHEAIGHAGEDADVSVTTCRIIAKAGYRIGERVVRAAQVLVVDPPA